MNEIGESNRRLRVVIPGGSGQVGEMLARHFAQQGHMVTVLTRGPYTASWQTVHWDGLQEGSWTEHLEGADVCINLAGRSVNCRYTAENRQEIYESRIESTRLLHRVIARLNDPPRLWLNASAATIYGREVDADGVDLPREESSFSATQLAGKGWEGKDRLARRDFTARVLRDWETAFFETETPRTRKVALRSGMTLSPKEGNVFQVFLNLVRMSLGGTQGSGNQFISWIHEADYARAIDFLIAREEIEGAVNLVAPNPVPNWQFLQGLREAWGMPNGIPAPSWAIHLGAFFLRTEAELVLSSCRAVPERLLDAGFNFEFEEWPDAAEDLARRWRHRHD